MGLLAPILFCSGLRASMEVSESFTLDTRNITPVEESDIFVLNTRPAWGGSDVSSSLASVVLDTVDGLNVGEFYIGGPESIASGETGTYQMYLRNPSTGEVSNISSQARLRLAGGRHPNVGIGGRTVFAYDVATATNVTVYATYRRTDGQVASEPFTITLTTANLDLTANASKTDLGNGSFQIDLSATATGGSGGYVYAWDLDGDGDYDDASGASATVFKTNYGTHRFKVQMTDSSSNIAHATAITTLNKPLETGQPERILQTEMIDPPPSIGAGQLFDYAGRDLNDLLCDFSAGRKGNGLIIITHGMREDMYGDTEWWPFVMAEAIKDRYAALGMEAERPNILIYDWTIGATPSKPSNPEDQVVIQQLETGLKWMGQALTAVRDGATKALLAPVEDFVVSALPYGDEFNAIYDIITNPIGLTAEHGPDTARWLIDIATVQDIALQYGSALGGWIQLNSLADEYIDPDAPLHLIGHSAGGFVVGEAALELQVTWNKVVDRVTMLDTPLPWLPHYSILPDPVYLERVVTSPLGLMQFEGMSKLPFNDENPFYTYYLVEGPGNNNLNAIGAHTPYAQDWYMSTINDYSSPLDPVGFQQSPFAFGPKADNGNLVTVAAAYSAYSIADPVEDPWSDFSTFGNVTASGTERIVTEGFDAGLFKNIKMPVGAARIEFKSKFDTPSDGDYLLLTFEGKILRTISNLDNRAGVYRSFVIPAASLAGETGTLSFTLISRGEANAVLRLKDLIIVEDGDLDGDGVLNEEEISLGLDPYSLDTDGDGLIDGDELPESDPLIADTDGDGSDDLAERIAGTDPRDPDSVFKVSQLQAGTSSYALWWKSIPGKTYRVIWSETPEFSEFEVIAPELTAGGYETNYIDYAKPASHPDKGFYRLEVVEE